MLEDLAEILFCFSLVIALAHVAMAARIWVDARRLGASGRVVLMFPRLWALATLASGIFAVGVYWLIHYSALEPGDRAARPAAAAKSS